MSTTAMSARPAASSFSESVEADGHAHLRSTPCARVEALAQRRVDRRACTALGWKSSASVTRERLVARRRRSRPRSAATRTQG